MDDEMPKGREKATGYMFKLSKAAFDELAETIRQAGLGEMVVRPDKIVLRNTELFRDDQEGGSNGR